MRLLKGHPLADRAEVVAEVERTCGGLDTGEHTGTIEGHAPHCLRFTGLFARPLRESGAAVRGATARAGTPGSGPARGRRRPARGGPAPRFSGFPKVFPPFRPCHSKDGILRQLQT
ncbi:hypothetical protein GCM10010406_47500 [Streptomyces thermolineatus]|uniref:Uncharacterized protein n=1 Tax=Streptomyces thermolineatus TaxID=44033 RepID=A0ABN3MSI4_9ACTN